MSIQIINGIQLPAFDVEMLTLGKLIAVPFNQSQKEGNAFWLYPSQKLPYNLSPEQYYQPEYLTNAKIALGKYTTFPIHLKAWARCEYHWRINPEQKHLLPKIAQSTIWNLSALEHMFEQYQVLKLLMLRVYRLSNYCIVNVPPEPGAFYWSKSEDLITTASDRDIPVVYEANFNKRKTLLLTGNVYPYRDIEALQFQCEQISDKNPDVQRLNHDINQFLGWFSVPPTEKPDTTLDWINDIAQVGNSSDGNEFERLVRKSFIKLGFSCSNTNPKANLDPEKLGGSGGLDFYCESPYPVVGECKATKTEKVTDGTAAQLIKLGYKNLQQQYKNCIKIIMAAGELNEHALLTTVNNEINVIRPETLQTLVELKHNYPGSIDLLELKQCLEKKPFGDNADSKINNYINNILQNIKLRSHVIKAVKELGESERGYETVEIRVQYNAVFAKEQTLKLEDEAAHDLVIELSSPLTGYLGRIKGNDWRSDRFYFLRDLPTS
ncbi:MAG: DUF1802 family protein [Hassallia sp.]